MKRIVVNTTSIAIEEYKKGNYKKLMNSLSVWDSYPNGGKYISYSAFIEDEESDTLYIHRGYDLKELMSCYPYHNLVFDLIPDSFKHMKLNMKSKPRNELQQNCIRFLLGIGNYKDTADENQKFVCLDPGTGKTYCAIEYTVRKGLIPIIIVNNDTILKQWKESYLKFTDINEKEIFTISGSPSIKKLMKTNNSDYKVFLASHRTIASFTSDDLSLMNQIFSKIGVGVKIFDEAHIEWKNIFNIDMYTDVKYNIYLTATPSRSNPNENMVYERMFGSIPVFGLNGEQEEDLYRRVVYFDWNSHPTTQDIMGMSNNHGFDSNAYNDYLLENKDAFFPLVEDLITQFFEKDNESKIAVVVNCNNMIQELHDYLSEIFPEKSIGRFCGLIPNKKERFKELDKDIILTTLRGFNMAIDVYGLNVLINTVSFSSETLIKQLCGRLRYIPNKKSWFIDFLDTGFSQCVSHRRFRKKFLKNIAIKEFVITNK